MKQRVVVQAVIRRDEGDTVLLLRRSTGRPELVGMYELPGGRLDDNEQPEDALKRYIKSELGQDLKSATLLDVLSMNHSEELGIQHVFILYRVILESDQEIINLGHSYDQSKWISMQELHQFRLRDSAQILLDSLQHPTLTDVKEITPVVTKTTAKSNVSKAIIYSDGGSRGNPGNSAAAFVIMDESQHVIDEGGEYLGITTNNQAEYHGVRLGLERAIQLGINEVDFRMDSLLVVNQMKDIYKIKNRDLWPIHERIEGLLEHFEKVTFTHVDRSLNQQADSFVNKLLDEHEDGDI